MVGREEVGIWLSCALLCPNNLILWIEWFGQALWEVNILLHLLTHGFSVVKPLFNLRTLGYGFGSSKLLLKFNILFGLFWLPFRLYGVIEMHWCLNVLDSHMQVRHICMLFPPLTLVHHRNSLL